MEHTESEKAFKYWMMHYPESFHSLDMRRFYDFVKAVFIEGKFRDSSWLMEKDQKILDRSVIERYSYLFVELQEFYKYLNI